MVSKNIIKSGDAVFDLFEERCVICKYRDHCAIKPFTDHFKCGFVKPKKKYIKEQRRKLMIKDQGDHHV